MWWWMGMLACGTPEVPPEPPDTPELVVLVVLDTVSARHVSLQGYDQPTTPSLQALAKGATTYTRAFSTASWTLPAHGSLFTGLLPHEHRGHKYRFDAEHGVAVKRAALPDQAHTLAEHLASAGWATGAFVTNQGFKGTEWGLHQGFGTYVVKRQRGTGMVQQALGWLKEQTGDTLLFVNLMDAHVPYRCDRAPQPFRGCDVEGKANRTRVNDAARLGNDPAFLDALRHDYDAGIASADLAVRRLLDGLRTLERFDDATVIVTSDHGELFGEHGMAGHGKDLYNPLVRVPLVVKAPGQQEAGVDEALISLLHVPRIALDLAGVDSAPFQQHWPRSHVVAQHYFSLDDEINGDFPEYDRVRQAVITSEHKLLASSTGNRQLVRTTDWEELEDLSDSRPDVRATLEGLLPTFEQGEPPTLADDQEALRALGYVE